MSAYVLSLSRAPGNGGKGEENWTSVDTTPFKCVATKQNFKHARDTNERNQSRQREGEFLPLKSDSACYYFIKLLVSSFSRVIAFVSSRRAHLKVYFHFRSFVVAMEFPIKKKEN